MVTPLSCTTVQWRGLVLSSDRAASPFGVRTLAGWDERPDVRLTSIARPAAHGRLSGSALADERIVTLAGQIVSPDRDALLWELDAAMYLAEPGAPSEILTVTRAGRTLYADAQLTAFRTPTDGEWASGKVPYAIEWRCADPLRYGDPIAPSTGFPTSVGGLRYDLYTDGAGGDLGFLDYGEASASGVVTLSNPGTAAVPVLLQITGPIPSQGFDVIQVGSGKRLTFEDPVGSGSVLVMDGATGAAVIDGNADRAGQLTWRDWPVVPPRSSIQLLFSPRGPRSDATMTAVFRPGWW